MIWIAMVLCSVTCVLLSKWFTSRLGRRLRAVDARTFEGPARLELFGHVTHVGWVRQGAERIDVLTIEGEALQCDARARYRLAPLTWREFVDECLRHKEEDVDRFGHEIRTLKEARAEAEERRGALRIAIADALNQLSQNCPSMAATILDVAREKDEEHDALPF